MGVKEKMTAIADNIRRKTGKTEPLNLDDMASGVNEVYDKGSVDGWNDFLNLCTSNGTRTNYRYFFTDTNFGENTINISPKSIGHMFYKYKGDKIPDGIDCSKAETTGTTGEDSVTYLCAYARKLKKFPDINIPPAKYWQHAFRTCENLEKIEIIRVSEADTGASFYNAFYKCVALKDITFEGVIKVSISFKDCPLSVESMKSVITHLKDYAGTEDVGKYTLTLKDSCKTLMAEQGAMEELGGKTYDAYIADIGWNLA